MVANYLDIPLELSYHFNKSDFNKSIRITAGAKLGLLFDSKNKYKYSYEGDTRTVKNKMDLQLSPFRFGVYGE
ncbi:MAG: PorT family protein [Cytophagales bacterium]|nr:PorT family protein [Cytophagales bacterium]